MHAFRVTGTGSPSLDYTRFQACGRAVQQQFPALGGFFAPWVFMCLHRDASGRISTNGLFDLVMRKVALQQTRLSLCLCDPACTGYVREREFETFVLDQIRTMPQLSALDDDFFAVYAIYATRGF